MWRVRTLNYTEEIHESNFHQITNTAIVAGLDDTQDAASVCVCCKGHEEVCDLWSIC